MKPTIKEGNKRIRRYVKWSFIAVGIFSIPLFFVFDTIYSDLILFSAVIFCFVNCIRHLRYYRNGRGLVITALVFCSLYIPYIIIFLLAILIGIIRGMVTPIIINNVTY